MARKSNRARRLEIGRLDEYFQKLKAQPGLPMQVPPRGWIHAARDALGMSVAQLANRLDVTRAATYKLEQRELSRTVSLKQLDKAAEAMDCDVVYMIVPRNTFEQAIRDQTRKKAERKLSNANLSMGLEAEGVRDEKLAAAVSSSSGYTEALTDRYLWDE